MQNKTEGKRIVLVGISLSEFHTSESFFIGSSFTSKKQQKTNTKPYKFLCNTKVLYSVRNQPTMVIGLSVSCACDKVS